ncbi:MAG: radical SAM/SPASM domain-containing protein [Candidatus Aenigmatarchaeota archaeon]
MDDDVRFYRPSCMMLDVTEYCPSECGHCGYECGPYGNSLDKKTITKLMKDAAEEGIQILAISGGEPFSSRNLYHAVREAKKNSIKLYSIMTSGFFGKNRSSARRVLERLKDAGYSTDKVKVRKLFGKTDKVGTHFQLSIDKFHEEFVPHRYVFNVIDAYYDTFGTTDGLAIDFSFLKDDAEDLNKMVKSLPISRKDDGGYVYNSRRGDIEFILSPIVYAGRARNIEKSSFMTWPVRKVLKDIRKKKLPCIGPFSAHNMVTIRGDGSAYPCCSLFYKEIPRLKIGSVNEDSLHKITEHANKDPLLNFMMVKNTTMLFGRIGKTMLDAYDNYLDNAVTHECEICKDMLSDEKVLAVLESKARKKLPKLRKLQKKIYPEIYPDAKP